MNAQTAQVVPFQNKEWDFDIKEVIKHVDPHGNGTPAEHKYFFELCKAQNLNPLIKEVYFIKYGNTAAAVVINVDTFVSRANEYPDYDGYTAGWIVGTEADPKDSHVPFGKLLGAFCKVGRKGKSHDVVATVRLDAFDTGKSRWKIDPWGMIQKCAVAAAHRKAYPKAFTGIYEWSEMDQARDGTAKDVTPPKPVSKPKVKNVKKLAERELTKEEVGEVVAEVVADATEQPEVLAEIDAAAQKDLLGQIANDLDMLLAPDNNPNTPPVFDKDAYARMKEYIHNNWHTWQSQLDKEHFGIVQAQIKTIRAEFSQEIIEEFQPS
ncbi:phage recombination protein Bet [uncultured Mediterranean phage uvMED]|nr:phage recombination protein Bet [uncultured Mediterranean phage uvMED]